MSKTLSPLTNQEVGVAEVADDNLRIADVDDDKNQSTVPGFLILTDRLSVVVVVYFNVG